MTSNQANQPRYNVDYVEKNTLRWNIIGQSSIAYIGDGAITEHDVKRHFSVFWTRAQNTQVIQLRLPHFGLDALCADQAITRGARSCKLVALQLPDAHYQSNLFYRVHPRRNDRFITAETKLKQLYPEVDFTEFSFVGHIISELHQRSPDRFALVRSCLQSAWTHKISHFLGQINRRTLIFRTKFRSQHAAQSVENEDATALITSDMINALAGPNRFIAQPFSPPPPCCG